MTFTQDNINALASEVIRYIPSQLYYIEGTRNHIQSQCNHNFISQFRNMVRDVNRDCGTRVRKTLGALRSELSSRGINWSESASGLISAHFGDITMTVRHKKGLDITLELADCLNPPEWVHITMCESDVADLMEYVAAAYLAVLNLIDKTIQETGRKQMISEIEYPVIEKDIADYLVPRGIRYTLENSDGKNTLFVQILKDIWIRKSVNMETLKQDLSIIPYLIKRPDCIKSDGHGYSLFHKWNWDK